MPRTYYTIDDLYTFCKENNFSKFSSKEHDNKPLIVQSIETFEAEDASSNGILPVHLMACHCGLNRNGSAISKENMEKYKNTFKGRPILGAIYLTDTGEYEFRAHDMTINDDDEIEYIEQIVGVVSESDEPYLKYDIENDKDYLMVNGNIFEDYTKAAEILQRRKTCKCSVEIVVDELSWNADEDYLSIDKFGFRGVTILGYEQDGVTPIEEGMKGSKISIEDFGEKNSMFSQTYQNKLIDTLEKLNNTLSTFQNTNINQKGVNKEMNKLQTLMEKYEVTMEDIDFEVDGLSDEELKEVFKAHFDDGTDDGSGNDTGSEGAGDGTEAGGNEGDSKGGEGTEGGITTDTPTEPTEDEDDDDDNDLPDDDESTSKKKYSIDENGDMTLTYVISHEDIKNSLYNLMYANGNYGYIIETYDDSFIYQDWEDGRFYKQEYSIDGDNVSFGDNKVEMFQEWLTQSEKDALAALKAEYAVLKEFKDEYDLAEVNAKKDEIFNREEYAILTEDEAFAELKKNAGQYSVDGIEEKVKVIFADHVMKDGQFSMTHKDEKKPTKKVGFNFSKPAKKQAYGNLFN